MLYAITRWLLPRSLTRQIALALIVLFSAAAGSVGFTLYELDLRKHDYVILNLAGQLRALAQSMVSESLHFREHRTDAQGAAIFQANMRQQAETFDRIVTSLQNRYLDPELTGRSDPLVCSWDQQSIAQLNLTARTWREFRTGIEPIFMEGASHQSLEKAADYVVDNEAWVTVVAKNLSGSFQQMMEGKMRLIALFNQISLALFFVAIIVLLSLLYYTFVRPLRHTLAGVDHLSNGEFGYQIPIHGGNEIGQIARVLNLLSCRLSSLFKLTERISQANTLDETLQFVFEQFRSLLPLDWVGILERDSSGERFVLQHLYTMGQTRLAAGDSFRAEGTLLGKAMAEHRPLHISNLVASTEEDSRAEFAASLAADGRGSVLLFPLTGDGEWSAVLAFAVRDTEAYTREHLELLGNIAAQVSHGFQKTVVTENLVISAVSGLAKLAESRDPETGDHLVRMARYAALIAEEVGREGPYREQIDAAVVRDIFRFAPMHDIGKVGVEDRILLKPGRLDGDERRQMERHPVIGGEVLRRCEMQMNAVGHSVFRVGIEIAECHHEKFDGSGYPSGLEGEAIPLSARIVAVADVFDALTSRRPYKAAWSVDKALELFEQESGKHFDPVVVAAMQRALPRMMQVYEQLKHV